MIHVVIAVVLSVLGLAAVFVLGAAARALILAATHRGRHEQREQAAEAEAKAFVAELRGLPAKGKDIYTDRNVWLPRTCAGHCLPSHHCQVCHGAEPGPPVVADITDARPSGFIKFEGDVHPDVLDAVRRAFAGDDQPDARCCECRSLRVTYFNYRDQPFCAACANGEGPDPGGHTYDRDIPDWVWLELGKHGPDAAVESIAARVEAAS